MNTYVYSLLGFVGRLGNQFWQVAATIDHSLRDPGSRAGIPADWEYRPYVCLPDALYRAPQADEQIIDVAHGKDGPYYQALPHISKVAPGLKRLYGPSQSARARLEEHHGALLADTSHKTAIHVRRTDYLENPDRFPPLTPLYYRTALKTIRQAVGETKVLVFSDDIRWCRENAEEWFGTESELAYIEGHVRPIPPQDRARSGPPDDILDLWLMAKCDAHIIANSSFSWWGAFLSEQKRVFYPDRWFGPDAQHSEQMWEAFPESWIQLPC